MILSRQSFYISAAVILLLAGYSWFQIGGRLLDQPHTYMPPGQFLYVLSKLFGLLAVVVLWFQLCWGLTITGASGKNHLHTSFHKILGVVTISVVLLHFLLFFMAVWMRKGEPPLNLLMPDLSDYYHLGLFLGQLAILLVILVAVSGIRKLKSSGFNVWRWLHRLSVVAFLLAMLHSYMIGSESRSAAMPWAYLFMISVMVFLLARRFHAR